ncbi:uncharacterized protein LOC116340520 [Contarinia nasturtii]|uniref:uncharacterized protein LOC116340520 n=1 Tax=Contarinia nasturtii TaxID=265458 RepID=UPI0012D46E9F|nr:uncharacterized protein LOC116340520 [Contarinia nasturtii]
MVSFVSAFLFSLVAISTLNWVQCEPKKFAKEVKDIYEFAALHSSSVQPYFTVNRTLESSEINAENAVKIWMLCRHGSRTADDHEVEEFKSFEHGLRAQIISNLENVAQCPLSKENWKNLKKWKWNTAFEGDRAITESGRTEVKKIGENMKARFPKVFKGPFNKKKINVVATDEPRIISSAATFIEAIVGNEGHDNVLSVANEEETQMIKAYDFPPYRVLFRTTDNPKYWKLWDSDIFKKMVEGVNNRLLFNDRNFTIRRDRVLKMYHLCQFEGIWMPGGKSVCVWFSKDVEILEEYNIPRHPTTSDWRDYAPIVC